MEPIAQFDENFPRIVEVKSAKGQAVIEHYAPVAHIQSAHGSGEILSEILADREINRLVGR